MKTYILLFLIVSSVISAQTKDIEFNTTEKDNKLSIFCYNNTNSTQEVSYKITEYKGLNGYSKPIKKKVAPNSKKLFAVLTFKGKYSYSSSFIYNPILSKSDIAKKEKLLKEKTIKKNTNIKKGIVVFTKEGCPRCSKTTSYLIDNNIDFKLINISDKKKPENKELMWSLLRESKLKSNNVMTPVVLINGELSHSHKDLGLFLNNIKK